MMSHRAKQDVEAVVCPVCSAAVPLRPRDVVGRLVCIACGTEFVFPPLEQGPAVALQAACKVHGESGRAHSYRIIEAGLLRRVERPGAILDVGCGAGPFMAVLLERGWQPVGVDINRAAVDAARDHGFDVRLGSVDAVQPPEGGFDAVVMMNALEYFHAPLQALEQVGQRIRPGGAIALETPNARYHRKQAAVGRLLRLKNERLMFVEPHAGRRFFAFTPQSIQVALTRSGFVDVAVLPSLPRETGRVAERLLRRLVFLVTGALFRLTSGRLNLSPSVIVFATRR